MASPTKVFCIPVTQATENTQQLLNQALADPGVDQVHLWDQAADTDEATASWFTSLQAPVAVTPDAYLYLGETRLDPTLPYTFRVKATNDVALLLAGEDGNEYELVLGGWENSMSIFRLGKQTAGLASTHALTLNRSQWNTVVISQGRVTLNDHEWELPVSCGFNKVWHATGWGSHGVYDISSPATKARYCQGFNPETFYQAHTGDFQTVQILVKLEPAPAPEPVPVAEPEPEPEPATTPPPPPVARASTPPPAPVVPKKKPRKKITTTVIE